ncbi:NAD(P) transhydrogenase subunit alpha [Porphyromonas macacae]|uniref:proton-translocating NAD(P)(+) transhydrogenase n=1 Tax=Porphyromonas macacae TaxID=28115 RepID=A0A379DI90_9PORP|nr:NAD(P) transhydrogenase subunit alpha [Porphyromonas macacae]SUB77743.1 NAD(P) transhydrogenase subunit alpha [Porphyromonas macacae]
MSPVILIAIFIVATVIGYMLIKKVPSMLHTPLMSGMNALSGVTVLGAIAATGVAAKAGQQTLAVVLGFLAIVLASINVVGGFGVTDRMLRMFDKKKTKGGDRAL